MHLSHYAISIHYLRVTTFFAAEKCAGEISFDDSMPALRRYILSRTGELAARVVYKEVNATKLLQCITH